MHLQMPVSSQVGSPEETQTSGMQSPADDRVQMDQAVMCGNIFESVHSHMVCLQTILEAAA